MAGRAVSRVFVASKMPDLVKEIRRLLPGSSVKVEDLHYDGKTIDLQAEDMSRQLKEVEVALCDRDALLQWLTAGATPRLKWAQSLSAGVDALMQGLDFKKPKHDFILTRTGGDFGDIMGEYVIGHIIAHERDFAGIREDQTKRVFNSRRFGVFRPLYNLSIGILGYGTIGKRVAEMCKALGMTVWAANSSQKTTPSTNVDHFRGVESLPEVLHNVDYLCSILPSTPDTRDLLSGDVLSPCQHRKTVLINMGRGSVISDESLVRAVREGWLGGAILDVFHQEPLPADSPLWSLPNVTITPHVSGPNFPQPMAQAFVDNLGRYVSRQPLHNVVDWNKGY